MSNICKKVKILNAESNRFSEHSNKLLAELGEVENVIEADRDTLLSKVKNTEVLFIGIKNLIDLEVFDSAPSLKYIVTPTTGLNHIDLKVASENGVKVLSLKGETGFLKDITATAELTWGLLLSLYRKISAASSHVISGEWDRNQFYGHELKDKKLGVIGYGRLGKIVSEYGKAFRMNVVAYDIDKEVIEKNKDIKFVTIEELLFESDVVSIHIPFNDKNKLFFDQSKFNLMKKNSVLLNTSRGEIIDELALLRCLKNNNILGAGLDVLSNETSKTIGWLNDSPLKKYAEKSKNLIITPHIGGVTFESVESTNNFMIEKLKKQLLND